jgi:hypothetical protein
VLIPCWYQYFKPLVFIQAANSVGTVASKIGPVMSMEQRNSLIDILVTGLNGRTWNGKENLLKALSTVCSSCKYVYEYIIFIGDECFLGNIF